MRSLHGAKIGYYVRAEHQLAKLQVYNFKSNLIERAPISMHGLASYSTHTHPRYRAATSLEDTEIVVTNSYSHLLIMFLVS